MKFCKLVCCCLLFAVACMPAFSQTQVRVNIPFDFNVGNHMLPSGQYTVLPGLSENNAIWLITSDSHKSAFVATNPVSSPDVEHNYSLIFRRFGGQYSLVQFWSDGHQGHDVIRPKRDRLMLAKSEVVEIAAER